jgi:para-nitrobenzyl esterase
VKKLLVIITCLVLTGISVLLFSFIRQNDSGNKGNIIQIENGWISGVKSETSDVFSFKGIPFAAPPVGGLRWKAPQPVTPWKGLKKCDAGLAKI